MTDSGSAVGGAIDTDMAEKGGAGLPPPPVALLAGASLFLDFDGTLVEIAARPEAVVVDAGLGDLLRALGAALDGRLAVVSGRPADDLLAYLRVPVLAAGSHGLERRWPDGRRADPDAPGWLADAIAEAECLAAGHPGMQVEAKPFGIALHFRGAPDAEAACRALAERIAATGAVLQAGKMVFELRAAGPDKGEAIADFMAAPPLAGRRPIFIGDDLTDEAGFHVATALGGAGILVGARSDTAARYALPDVAATRAWLEAATRALT